MRVEPVIFNKGFTKFNRKEKPYLHTIDGLEYMVVADFELQPGAGNGALPFWKEYGSYFDRPTEPDGYYSYPKHKLYFTNIPVGVGYRMEDIYNATKAGAQVMDALQGQRAALMLPNTKQGNIFVPATKEYVYNLKMRFLSPADQLQMQHPVQQQQADLNSLTSIVERGLNLITWCQTNAPYALKALAPKKKEMMKLVDVLKNKKGISTRVLACRSNKAAAVGELQSELYKVDAMVSVPDFNSGLTDQLPQLQLAVSKVVTDIESIVKKEVAAANNAGTASRGSGTQLSILSGKNSWLLWLLGGSIVAVMASEPPNKAKA